MSCFFLLERESDVKMKLDFKKIGGLDFFFLYSGVKYIYVCVYSKMILMLCL